MTATTASSDCSPTCSPMPRRRASPTGLVPETLRAARRVRRWPRWLALIKEPPMRISSRVAVGSPTVRLAYVAILTLLLTLAGHRARGRGAPACCRARPPSSSPRMARALHDHHRSRRDGPGRRHGPGQAGDLPREHRHHRGHHAPRGRPTRQHHHRGASLWSPSTQSRWMDFRRTRTRSSWRVPMQCCRA